MYRINVYSTGSKDPTMCWKSHWKQFDRVRYTQSKCAPKKLTREVLKGGISLFCQTARRLWKPYRLYLRIQTNMGLSTNNSGCTQKKHVILIPVIGLNSVEVEEVADLLAKKCVELEFTGQNPFCVTLIMFLKFEPKKIIKTERGRDRET